MILQSEGQPQGVSCQHFQHRCAAGPCLREGGSTPTSSSWLNLVEGCFAEITRQRIRRGTFESVSNRHTQRGGVVARLAADGRRYRRTVINLARWRVWTMS